LAANIDHLSAMVSHITEQLLKRYALGHFVTVTQKGDRPIYTLTLKAIVGDLHESVAAVSVGPHGVAVPDLRLAKDIYTSWATWSLEETMSAIQCEKAESEEHSRLSREKHISYKAILTLREVLGPKRAERNGVRHITQDVLAHIEEQLPADLRLMQTHFGTGCSTFIVATGQAIDDRFTVRGSLHISASGYSVARCGCAPWRAQKWEHPTAVPALINTLKNMYHHD
jgi:hypothetical protein